MESYEKMGGGLKIGKERKMRRQGRSIALNCCYLILK